MMNISTKINTASLAATVTLSFDSQWPKYEFSSSYHGRGYSAGTRQNKRRKNERRTRGGKK